MERRHISPKKQRRAAAEESDASPQKKRRAAAQASGVPRRGYTIAEFCFRHHFSESYYFKLKSEDRAPREDRSTGKPIITDEAEAAWLADMAAEKQETTAA